MQNFTEIVSQEYPSIGALNTRGIAKKRTMSRSGISSPDEFLVISGIDYIGPLVEIAMDKARICHAMPAKTMGRTAL